MTPSIRTVWDLTPDLSVHIEAVHRLSTSGAVIAHRVNGSSKDGFHAEWLAIDLLIVEGDKIVRCEVFDELDLDAAIARFDELSYPTPRLENTAARVFHHVWSHYAAGDWHTVAATVSDDYLGIDHRMVVKAEVQHGRDSVVRDLRAAADVGFTISMVSALAIRGEHLVLALVRAAGPDTETVQNDALNVVEVDQDGRIKTVVVYEPEDMDSAIAELEARFVAGEVAPYASTWSTVADSYASLWRNEFPAMTPDAVSIDHRRAASFAPGELNEYIRAGFELGQQLRPYIEIVHRLNSVGAVVTLAATGNSREGFDAEWRGVNISLVDGNMISRCEFFDEADLDAAIARFEALQSEARQLGNPASRALDRFLGRVVARDWDAIADMLAADYYTDDRRHLVGGGIYGRVAEIASVQVQANLGVTHITPTLIAVRGQRLALSRVRYSGHNQDLETFVAEILAVFEIDTDGRFVAAVAFDPDDLDAAIAELDARYLAGEAAAHAHAWRVITQAYATLNGGEIPPTANDFVDIDHRRLAAIGSGDLKAYVTAAMNDTTYDGVYVEAVHRLTDLGAVVTHVASGTSRTSFAADWRNTDVYTVEGDLIDRCEVFDESELDAALARFDQLQRPVRKLKNAASRVSELAQACLVTEDWTALTAIAAEDIVVDDRRRVISVGIHRGPDESVGNMRAASDIGFGNVTSTVVATRGERLPLDRLSYSGRDSALEPFSSEVFRVFEIDAEEKVTAAIIFDTGDIEPAYAELDARYLAGEAAPHANTWSAIMEAYAAFNRHELPPTTPDWVNVDHRRAATIAPGDLAAHIRATREVAPHIRRSIEAVHRLNSLGAVVTHTGYGTSQEGFDAEWRLVALLTFAGDLVSRAELFDEADLDRALARFDELYARERRLGNAASRVSER